MPVPGKSGFMRQRKGISVLIPLSWNSSSHRQEEIQKQEESSRVYLGKKRLSVSEKHRLAAIYCYCCCCCCSCHVPFVILPWGLHVLQLKLIGARHASPLTITKQHAPRDTGHSIVVVMRPSDVIRKVQERREKSLHTHTRSTRQDFTMVKIAITH